MQDATKLSEEMKELSEKQKKVKEFTTSKELIISKANSEIRDWRMKISEAMKVKEPKADSSELLLQQEIDMLEQSLLSKQLELDGKTPFDDIIDSEREDLKRNKDICSKKSDCIKDSEENLKHYQFWQAGFGDKGIRKVVVDGIIPQLNNRIAYWLQFLIDNKIALRFDSEFNETIERNPADGDPYIYHAMSAGQRRRLNLAVSQAFADIMMLSCGTVPSLVFLDEVTTNIDPIGVQGIYNMIQELMEDKQVFVTTHDKDLIKMLETATTMNLVHEGGFTIVKN
jgi:DNA repair exonuclease SbcCD ATPase subunit